jgi:beta-phosphoglucomutase-like phosphatase (HAD superfamily)
MPSAKHSAVIFDLGGVLIDDAPHNVAAGAAVGLQALHFTNPKTLRRELVALGMLD